MANLTSVIKDLEQERNRLGAQLEGINRALSVLNGTSDHRATRTISAAGRARIAAGSLGKGQGAKSRFHRHWQEAHDVASRPQADCRSPKSTVGKVAEGAQEGVGSQ